MILYLICLDQVMLEAGETNQCETDKDTGTFQEIVKQTSWLEMAQGCRT